VIRRPGCCRARTKAWAYLALFGADDDDDDEDAESDA
jgi:hypothetical protein